MQIHIYYIIYYIKYYICYFSTL